MTPNFTIQKGGSQFKMVVLVGIKNGILIRICQ